MFELAGLRSFWVVLSKRLLGIGLYPATFNKLVDCIQAIFKLM